MTATNAAKPFVVFTAGTFGATLVLYLLSRVLPGTFLIQFDLLPGLCIALLGIIVASLTLVLRVWSDSRGDFGHSVSALMCGAAYATTLFSSPSVAQWLARELALDFSLRFFICYVICMLIAIPVLCGEFLYRRCYKIPTSGFEVLRSEG